METLKETGSRSYIVHVPQKDAAMFRWLCKGMGWTAVIQKPKKTRLQLAIEEAHKGPTFQTNSIEELMEHLMK